MLVTVRGSDGPGEIGRVMVNRAGRVHKWAGLEQPVPVHLVLAFVDQVVAVQVDLGATHEWFVVQTAVVAPDCNLNVKNWL